MANQPIPCPHCLPNVETAPRPGSQSHDVHRADRICVNGLDMSPFQPSSLDVVYAGLQNTKHMQPVHLLVSPDSLTTDKAGGEHSHPAASRISISAVGDGCRFIRSAIRINSRPNQSDSARPRFFRVSLFVTIITSSHAAPSFCSCGISAQGLDRTRAPV